MNTSLHFANLSDEEILRILSVVSVPYLLEPLKEQPEKYLANRQDVDSLSREEISQIYLRFLKDRDLVLSLYMSDIVVDIIHHFKLSDAFKSLLTHDSPEDVAALEEKIAQRHCPITADMFMRLLDRHPNKKKPGKDERAARTRESVKPVKTEEAVKSKEPVKEEPAEVKAAVESKTAETEPVGKSKEPVEQTEKNKEPAKQVVKTPETISESSPVRNPEAGKAKPAVKSQEPSSEAPVRKKPAVKKAFDIEELPAYRPNVQPAKAAADENLLPGQLQMSDLASPDKAEPESEVIQELRYQIMNLTMENETLKEENRSLLFSSDDQNEIASLNDELNAKNEEIDRLREQLTALSDERDELKKSLAEYAEYKRQYHDALAQLRDYKIQYISLQAEMDQMRYTMKNDSKRLKILENKQRSLADNDADWMMAMHDLTWYKKQWNLPGDAPLHRIWAHLNREEARGLARLLQRYDRLLQTERKKEIDTLKEILIVKEAILILLRSDQAMRQAVQSQPGAQPAA